MSWSPVAPCVANRVQGATGDQDIDGVLSGYKWSGPVTFSFPQGGDRYLANRVAGLTYGIDGPVMIARLTWICLRNIVVRRI
jgi:hypothetical protein